MIQLSVASIFWSFPARSSSETSLGFVRAFRSASSRSRLSALFSLARRVASANCHRFCIFPLRPILNAAHIKKPMLKTDSSPIWRYSAARGVHGADEDIGDFNRSPDE